MFRHFGVSQETHVFGRIVRQARSTVSPALTRHVLFRQVVREHLHES